MLFAGPPICSVVLRYSQLQCNGSMQDTLHRGRRFRQYLLISVALLCVSPGLDTGDLKPNKTENC